MRVTLYSIATLSLLCASGMPVSAQMGGFGGVGSPPGMGGMGGGGAGSNVAGQNSAPPAPEEKKELPADDPAVQAATPPTADAKMLTKVGWCEVQVFGHTFSDAGMTAASLPPTHMHLAERLQQLNQKLNFKPGLKGIKLMDAIDEMVTFARDNAKKKPTDAVKPAASK